MSNSLESYRDSEFYLDQSGCDELPNFFTPLDAERLRVRMRAALSLQEGAELVQFDEIAKAFEEAKKIHQLVLCLEIPEILSKFRLDSPEALLQLQTLSFIDNPSLGPVAIALLKICFVILQAKARQFHHFDLSMLSLVNEMKKGLGLKPVAPSKFRVNQAPKEVGEVVIHTRAKKFERIIVKLLKSNGFSASYVEDGLGVRILVDDVQSLIYFVRELSTTFADCASQVTEVKANNFNFLSDEDLQTLRTECPELRLEHYYNPQAAGNFHAFFLLGVMNTPDVRVPFEVQFNKASSDLDAGMAHHSIYEFKQMLAALTNLYGYFTIDFLSQQVEELSVLTDRDADEIMNHLFQDVILEITPCKNGERRFASRTQFETMKEEGLMPEGISALLL